MSYQTILSCIARKEETVEIELLCYRMQEKRNFNIFILRKEETLEIELLCYPTQEKGNFNSFIFIFSFRQLARSDDIREAKPGRRSLNAPPVVDAKTPPMSEELATPCDKKSSPCPSLECPPCGEAGSELEGPTRAAFSPHQEHSAVIPVVEEKTK